MWLRRRIRLARVKTLTPNRQTFGGEVVGAWEPRVAWPKHETYGRIDTNPDALMPFCLLWMNTGLVS
jgi:hypothetical protein